MVVNVKGKGKKKVDMEVVLLLNFVKKVVFFIEDDDFGVVLDVVLGLMEIVSILMVWKWKKRFNLGELNLILLDSIWGLNIVYVFYCYKFFNDDIGFVCVNYFVKFKNELVLYFVW